MCRILFKVAEKICCTSNNKVGAIASPLHMKDRKRVNVALPERLFKYIPEQFVESFVESGDLLFRNLSFFRKNEEKGRGDLLEGLHMDHPDNPITITNLSVPSNPPWVGDAAMLNSIVPDDVFIFCFSKGLSVNLYKEFNCDTCVEIEDTQAFMGRLKNAISKLLSFQQYGLLHGKAYYYEPDQAAPADVSDPLNIPFFKHASYAHQKEYRFVLPKKNSLKVTKSIIHWELFSFSSVR